MPEAELPPFSGDRPRCPMCGNLGASTKFLGYGQCVHGGTDVIVAGYKLNERLHRECERCAFAWDEAVVT